MSDAGSGAPRDRGPHGLVAVDKPSGPTSHDVVSGVRRALATRKVGHAGTLDPMASGVLVVLVGEATKLASFLTAHDKCYRARISFGVSTTTLDAQGAPTERAAVRSDLLSGPDLARALAAERERTAQIPPAVSAIHVEGRRSYELARAGAPPVLPPRPVRVLSLEVLGAGLEADALFLDVELLVAKGYYVRALARDLGAALGCPAHLSALRRMASGPFRVDQACALDAASLRAGLVPLAALARRALPPLELTSDGALRARQGKALQREHFVGAAPPEGPAAWFDPDSHLVAVGEPCPPDDLGAPPRPPHGDDSLREFRVVRGFQRVS